MMTKLGLSALLVMLLVLPVAGTAAPPQSQVYISGSDSRSGYLGVQLQDVTKKLKEKKSLTVDKGAYVAEVMEESPAEKAGIKDGDVIVKFDGTNIQDSDDLQEAVRKTKRDTEVKIDLVRKAEKKTVTATIDRPPRSYTYSYRMPHVAPMPRMPKMPKMPRMPMHGFSFSMFNELEGLHLQELNRQLAEFLEVPDGRGVLVTEVEKGSKGEKAGFKAGDVITKLDGDVIRDVGDISDVLSDAKDNTDINCDLFRKGKAASLKWHVTKEDWDWDEEEEGDDRSSMNFVPYDGMECSSGKTDVLYRLKQDLHQLGLVLRERFQQLRMVIAEKIADFVETVTTG